MEDRLKLKTNEDLHTLASEMVYTFVEKDNITGPEANAVLAYLKFIKTLNDNSDEDSGENSTFELQL